VPRCDTPKKSEAADWLVPLAVVGLIAIEFALLPLQGRMLAEEFDRERDATEVESASDDNGGDSTLTDLTIVDYEITGADADKVYFVEDITGEVVNKGFINGYPLEFDPMGMMGTFDDAVLTITTDLGAAYGAAGEVFSFDLSATSTVIPEPGTALIGTLGLVGLGLRRRQVRRKPRTCASN